MIDRINEGKQYTIPFILAVVTLIFGTIGFLQDSYGMLNYSAFEKFIYKAVQLLQFEYDPDNYSGFAANPFLGIARWTGTITTIWIIVTIYIQFILQNAKLKKAKGWKNHCIVCGYGQIGKKLVASLLDNYKVVVIDPNINTDQFALNEKKGCTFIPQNADMDIPLKNAGITGADLLFAVTGDDIQNFQILEKAKSFSTQRKQLEPMQAFAHVDNYEIIQDVHDFKIFKDENQKFQARIFNADNTAARLIIKNHAPDRYHPIRSVNAEPMHILVAGFDKSAQALVTELARSCHFLNHKMNTITVMDENIDNAFKQYKGRFENIDKIIKIEQFDRRPDCMTLEDKEKINQNHKVDIIYIYHHDNAVEFLAMKRLRKHFGDEIPIVLCLQEQTALPIYAAEQSQIYPFRAFEKVTQYADIIEAPIEELAKKFHEHFLIDQGVNLEKPETQTKASHTSWENLPEEFKQSNRSLAAHVDIKLRALGMEYDDLDANRDQANLGTFDKALGLEAPQNAQILQLAKMEHSRWNADRFMAGWTFDKKRDDKNKKHDNLVPWEDLPDKIKMYDVDAILAIPKILSELGKGIYFINDKTKKD